MPFMSKYNDSQTYFDYENLTDEDSEFEEDYNIPFILDKLENLEDIDEKYVVNLLNTLNNNFQDSKIKEKISEILDKLAEGEELNIENIKEILPDIKESYIDVLEIRENIDEDDQDDEDNDENENYYEENNAKEIFVELMNKKNYNVSEIFEELGEEYLDNILGFDGATQILQNLLSKNKNQIFSDLLMNLGIEALDEKTHIYGLGENLKLIKDKI